MRSSITILGFIAFIITALASCKKNEEQPAPPLASLGLSDPQPYHVYHTNDTVRIRGMATYISNLHGYHVAILNGAEDTLFDVDSHVHTTELNIDEYWVNDQAAADTLRVIVSSEIDHEGNEIRKEVPIITQP